MDLLTDPHMRYPLNRMQTRDVLDRIMHAHHKTDELLTALNEPDTHTALRLTNEIRLLLEGVNHVPIICDVPTVEHGHRNSE